MYILLSLSPDGKQGYETLYTEDGTVAVVGNEKIIDVLDRLRFYNTQPTKFHVEIVPSVGWRVFDITVKK